MLKHPTLAACPHVAPLSETAQQIEQQEPSSERRITSLHEHRVEWDKQQHRDGLEMQIPLAHVAVEEDLHRGRVRAAQEHQPAQHRLGILHHVGWLRLLLVHDGSKKSDGNICPSDERL